MTNKDQLSMIKTALSDPGCESVRMVTINDEYSDEPVVWTVFRDRFLKPDSFLQGLEVESFKVNHAKFPEIGIGDIVSCPMGIGEVCDLGCSTLKPYMVFIDQHSESYEYDRHELVLLSRGSDEQDI